MSNFHEAQVVTCVTHFRSIYILFGLFQSPFQFSLKVKFVNDDKAWSDNQWDFLKFFGWLSYETCYVSKYNIVRRNMAA